MLCTEKLDWLRLVATHEKRSGHEAMLTRLGLKNFKAFGDEMQYADLAPITLIYGPNSGGKSSIIQALLMLKQSHQAHRNSYEELTPRRGSPLNLVTSGDLTDAGSYATLVNKHNTDLKIQISLDYEVKGISPTDNHLGGTKWIGLTMLLSENASKFWLNGNVNMSFASEGSQLSDVSYAFRSSFGLGYKVGFKRTSPNTFDWIDGVSEKSYIRFIEDVLEQFSSKETDAEETPFLARHFLDVARALHSHDDAPRIDIYYPSEEYEGILGIHMDGLPYLLNINEYRIGVDELSIYKNHLDGLHHLGPLRQPPQRYYELTSFNDSDIGIRGENTPYVLHQNPDTIKLINKWFHKDRFDIRYRIRPVKQFEDNQRLGLEFIAVALDDPNQTVVTWADVGFGINQLIPVIVQGLTHKHGVLCVEQPEIHLHPRLQANIADFLIETSRLNVEDEWTDEKKRVFEFLGPGNQWIVETHSEMIIRRIQRRIREGVISNVDVSVLYVDIREDGSSAIQQLKLDEDGRFIDEWPHGFFDEGYREIMGY